MCLTGAVFINVRRQLECLHFPCPSQLCEWSPLANSFDVWHSPRVSYRYLLMLLQSFLDRQTKVSNSPGNFQTVYYTPLEEILFFTFFFLISQNLCVLPMVQFFFFHMKFRFSILWKNNIGVSWDEFPSNNGFNIKHLSIVAKKKS